MYAHHNNTIQNLRREYESCEDYIALIVNGSVAREEAGEESDVDFYLLKDDRLSIGSSASKVESVTANDQCEAPCPEANRFIVSKDWLNRTRESGRELMRWAFYRAKVVYSRDQEIDAIVKGIPKYPEEGRIRRMESFHCQMYYHLSFFEFAYYSQTRYLMYETATQMILAIGRLILADSHKLYPGRKWSYRELQRTGDKPAQLCAAMEQFLLEPTMKQGHRIAEMVEKHKSYPVPPEGMKGRLVEESVLNLEEW